MAQTTVQHPAVVVANPAADEAKPVGIKTSLGTSLVIWVSPTVSIKEMRSEHPELICFDNSSLETAVSIWEHCSSIAHTCCAIAFKAAATLQQLLQLMKALYLFRALGISL